MVQNFFERHFFAILASLAFVLNGTLVLSATELKPARLAEDSLAEQKVLEVIQKHYPGAKVELTSQVHWLQEEPSSTQAAFLINDNGHGEAEVKVGDAQGSVSFMAWVSAWVAIRRVMPGEKLSPDLFVKQNINVASGMAREYRGVILGSEMDLTRLESKQTILEGQYALSSGVQRVPDLRRGDAVQIRLRSGEVVLSTSGIAQEPAYINDSTHVSAGKNKKDMVGKLMVNGVVEVRL